MMVGQCRENASACSFHKHLSAVFATLFRASYNTSLQCQQPIVTSTSLCSSCLCQCDTWLVTPHSWFAYIMLSWLFTLHDERGIIFSECTVPTTVYKLWHIEHKEGDDDDSRAWRFSQYGEATQVRDQYVSDIGMTLHSRHFIITDTKWDYPRTEGRHDTTESRHRRSSCQTVFHKPFASYR